MGPALHIHSVNSHTATNSLYKLLNLSKVLVWHCLSFDCLWFGTLVLLTPWSESSHACLPIFTLCHFSLKEIKAMNHLNKRAWKVQNIFAQGFVSWACVPQFTGYNTTKCREVYEGWILMQGAVFTLCTLTCASISTVFCLDVHEDLDTLFGCLSSESLYITKHRF